MRKIFFSIFLFGLFSICISQGTTFKITYYSPRDYGKGREATNLACAQDRDGVLYFGNAGGLLQYDGINWTFIPVKNRSSWIMSLAVSDDNVVYVGAYGEFGYLAPDESGRLSYVSLSDRLPEDERIFSDIVRLWAWGENVVFQSEEALFLFSNDKLTTLTPATSFHLSFLVNNELFVRQRNAGIMHLEGDSLVLVPGSSYLGNMVVLSLLPGTDPDKYIVVTYDDGFWSVDRDTFTGDQLQTTDSAMFRQSRIYGAIRLNDGKIALYTIANGIILTDESFKVRSVINKDNGLKVNVTNSLLQDYQGNLWACLDNGIVQVSYSSPVQVFGTGSGLFGNIRAIERYMGRLFVGTSEGLFVQRSDNKVLPESFVLFGNLSTEIKNLCLADKQLIAGTRDGLFAISNNEINRISNDEVNAICYSEKLKSLFVSGIRAFTIYRYSVKWEKIRDLPEITEIVVGFMEQTDNDNVILWLGTALSGAIRLHFTSLTDYTVDKYNAADGLIDNDWVYPFRINDKIVFSQRNGLLSFTDEKTILDHLPDSLKTRPPEYYKGFFDLYSIDTTRERINRPFYVIEDSKDRIYVNLDGDLGYFDKNRSYLFVDQPFCLEDIGKITVIFREPDGICWIGANDGLLMYNENNSKDYSAGFKTIITSVTAGRYDSLIYNGYCRNPDKGPDRNTSGKPEIKHSLNTLTFTFASPFFEGQDKMLYSYMLMGKDTIFSSWSPNDRIVLDNLWEGDYTFVVRAMNAYGHISSDTRFTFRILSPWYRKTWAVVVYILLATALIYMIIRIYARRLIEKNKKLEAIIRERTREISEKNIELQLQKEEILDSINYAQRIQTAVLPAEEIVQASLGDHFVIFRPKDIVSGDFYWTSVYKQYVAFCVADCTGHGVPGAFMSMLCISLLNEIVLKEKEFHPDQILGKAREMIIEALRQKGMMGEQRDGMDISMCIYNRDTSELEFAGANNPLYVVRKKGTEMIACDRQFEAEEYILYEIKADRMPIAFFDNMDQFRRNQFKVMKNDRLYMFSDGICDQFGGPDSKKFASRTLIATILETLTPEIREQKKLIERRIDEWKSYKDPKTGHTFTQIDDICLMGIMI